MAHKLNAHSSRSHAILRVNVSVTTGDKVRTSTASAIDLAGSEDNRRTENGKERMIESASINKSLFVLAKCVEAISQNQQRIPFRESKMTRILSLGQNNGMTVMILNLSPTRSYHLETLSSLNFANRTKKIEVREIENEPIYKGCHRPVPTVGGATMSRQPLRQLTNAVHNSAINVPKPTATAGDKPFKAFSVFSDKSRGSNPITQQTPALPKKFSSRKRSSDQVSPASLHPSKRRSPLRTARTQPQISDAALEDIIEKKVSDILAARALDQSTVAPQLELSEEVQRRLKLLEQKVEDQGKDDEREQGLTFLLMAKQHAVRGEDSSAFKMFQLAKDYFPDNAKLDRKIAHLQNRLAEQKERSKTDQPALITQDTQRVHGRNGDGDEDYVEEPRPTTDVDSDSAGSFRCKAKLKKARAKRAKEPPQIYNSEAQTPRTRQLLEIINTRDIARLRVMHGIGPKRAEKLLDALCGGDEVEARQVGSLAELGSLRGVGVKTVEKMRMGVDVSAYL